MNAGFLVAINSMFFQGPRPFFFRKKTTEPVSRKWVVFFASWVRKTRSRSLRSQGDWPWKLRTCVWWRCRKIEKQERFFFGVRKVEEEKCGQNFPNLNEYGFWTSFRGLINRTDAHYICSNYIGVVPFSNPQTHKCLYVLPLNQASLASCTSGWLLVTWFSWMYPATNKHNRNRLCLKLTWPCFSWFFDFLLTIWRILLELLPTDTLKRHNEIFFRKKPSWDLLEP